MTDNPLNEAFFQSMESSIVDVLDAETLPPACSTSRAFFQFEKDARFNHDWRRAEEMRAGKEVRSRWPP